MEYTKDMILYVNYGQESKTKKHSWFFARKLANVMAKHKIGTIIVLMTIMLMILDFILVSSFMKVLSNL